MSRRNKRKQVKEIDYFGAAPVRKDSFAERISNWVLWGNDKEAVDMLFPVPGKKFSETTV